MLLGGGDWADASAELLQVPDNITLEEAKTACYKWYNTEYLPALQHWKDTARKTPAPKFYTLREFIIAFMGGIPDTTTETWDDC